MRSTNTSSSEETPKVSKESGKIIDSLGENPDAERARTGPPDTSSPIAGQSSAIQQYMRAARDLAKEGLTFESIRIYRKILSVDSLPLSKQSLASISKAEKLLQEVRRLYEEVLESEDRRVRRASKTTSHRSETLHYRKTRDDVSEEQIAESEESEPVPIETLLAPREDLTTTQLPTDEVSQACLSSEEVLPLAGSDREMDNRMPVDDSEALPMANPGKDPQISNLQKNESETVHSKSGKDSIPQSSSPRAYPGDPGEMDLRERSGDEDPNLHYHLGVAYHQMELRDEAIQEFSKAYERGIKSLECLVMLARCYVEKGLFNESIKFIHKALKLNNLGKDQIQLLHSQIQEIKAKCNLIPSFQVCVAH